MDQSTLISVGHAFIEALDAAALAPQIAMWIRGPDIDRWKLWIVPPYGKTDEQMFYRTTAAIISGNLQKFGGLVASDVELVPDSHPGMQGIGRTFRVEGVGDVRFPGGRYDGFDVPDGIILRSAIDRRTTPRGR